MTKQRILSGIKPTGEPHLGNYLGAMKNWPNYQRDDTEVFYFIPDLHALNTRPDPHELRSMSLDLVAWLIAMGIDPDKSPIYAQSHVPAHSELNWILNNYATMGELSRMTQYKDKAAKSGSEGQLVALFDYPVLMAADILLYDADIIPVGDDQTQHVELTRDIAARFNNLYGEHFKLPKFEKQTVGARVMMLDNPTAKMSKSEAGEGCVYLKDEGDVIRKKFMRAVTDSENVISYDREAKPGVANLIDIYAATKGISSESATEELARESEGYGDLKGRVANEVIAVLSPVQQRFNELRADENYLKQVLGQGSQRARSLAEPKLAEIKHVIGLV